METIRILRERDQATGIRSREAGIWRLLLPAISFLAATTTLWAQPYAIDWATIDGGGGTSTGGVYSVAGTIGQPDAGTLSGGPYTLVGGFWGIIAAVQTPGAPFLTIVRTDTNTVVVSWSNPADGWQLDRASALEGSPIPWVQVSPPYQTNTTRIFQVEPIVGANQFYRLRKP